jgi:fucose 4-O-acetylase-like acetyltransferase
MTAARLADDKVLRYIGRNSMAIYLMHVLAISAIFMVIPNLTEPITTVIATLTGIGVPLLFQAICRRLRLDRMFGV